MGLPIDSEGRREGSFINVFGRPVVIQLLQIGKAAVARFSYAFEEYNKRIGLCTRVITFRKVFGKAIAFSIDINIGS